MAHVNYTIVTSQLRWLRLHSDVGTRNQTSVTATHWNETWIVRHTWVKAQICNPAGQFMLLVQYRAIAVILGTEGVTMLNGFPWRWLRRREFSESCASRFSVKIWSICEFRAFMGIITGLLRHCLWPTLGLMANAYVKTVISLGVWLQH